MIPITKKLILTGAAGGSFGLGAVTILASLVAFNGERFYHNDTLGIQFAMQVDAVDAVISVWMRAPAPMYIVTKLKDIVKIEEDGSENPAGLAELFPIGDPNFGAGKIAFEMFSAYEDQMPDLVNRDQNVVPMAFIRTTAKFPTILRYILIVGGMSINNWGLVKLAIIGSGLGLVALGGILLVLNQKSKNNLVVEMKDDVKSLSET